VINPKKRVLVHSLINSCRFQELDSRFAAQKTENHYTPTDFNALLQLYFDITNTFTNAI